MKTTIKTATKEIATTLYASIAYAMAAVRAGEVDRVTITRGGAWAADVRRCDGMIAVDSAAGTTYHAAR